MATVGEITIAMEKVFDRHRAEIKSISGVYKREGKAMGQIAEVQKLVEEFERALDPMQKLLVFGAVVDSMLRDAQQLIFSLLCVRTCSAFFA